jgi:hypothetical protein
MGASSKGLMWMSHIPVSTNIVSAMRGYPETFSHCRNEIKQPPCDRAGCEFSRVQRLLALVMGEADSCRRKRYAQKKARHSVADMGWKWA